MKALILAAGYGKRLRPLTESTPKPLIRVGGRTLLDRHLEHLATAGFSSVVVNVSWLAQQIVDYVGDGSRWGLTVRISHEGPTPLETGGAMAHALPLLGPEPFMVINADIVCQYPLQRLSTVQTQSCHLVLVDNPQHNPVGDFDLHNQALLNRPRLTYAGIGVFSPRLVSGLNAGPAFSVVPLIRRAAEDGQATGEYHRGSWLDIGSPERLKAARAMMGD